MAVSKYVDENASKLLNSNRIPFSPWSILTFLYLPVGLLLLMFRLCLIPQALLIILIIPEGRIKQSFLWIFFTVMGIMVVNRNFRRRANTARMLVANSISHFDYIPLHISMDCTTSSINGVKPLLSFCFYHKSFSSNHTNELTADIKKIPEFDDNTSIPDSVAVPFIAQPEPCPSNGKGLLKFMEWPFTVEDIVQPLTICSWRPLNINLTTFDSSEITDLLWTLFCPFTLFFIGMLPVVESRDDIDLQQFAKKTQKRVSTALDIVNTNVTIEDISTWKESLKLKDQSSGQTWKRTATGPIISESDFSRVRASSEIDRMVHQVLAVFPDAPQHAIRRDLLETRSVDVTLTNFLDGRLVVNDDPPMPVEPTPQIITAKGSFSLQDCHSLYQRRKSNMVEEAHRRYIDKHSTKSH